MLAQELGLERAARFDVSNACAGMLTGVIVLDRLIRSGRARRGMVVSGEQLSTITATPVAEISDALDPQFASLTVGDAGAAVILAGDGADGCAAQARPPAPEPHSAPRYRARAARRPAATLTMVVVLRAPRFSRSSLR
ncbi:hypothetical protein [Streptomyces sp. NRRL WC-3742]|uniref:hypothetical protein n=1 Tax=Streptomyces sp. NRRL WC-3742 TaxID=1463934 RepID=UPI00099C5571|nr:hypothetical protein [Streptomyces sp. NRRL WC-3742]